MHEQLFLIHLHLCYTKQFFDQETQQHEADQSCKNRYQNNDQGCVLLIVHMDLVDLILLLENKKTQNHFNSRLLLFPKDLQWSVVNE